MLPNRDIWDSKTGLIKVLWVLGEVNGVELVVDLINGLSALHGHLVSYFVASSVNRHFTCIEIEEVSGDIAKFNLVFPVLEHLHAVCQSCPVGVSLCYCGLRKLIEEGRILSLRGIVHDMVDVSLLLALSHSFTPSVYFIIQYAFKSVGELRVCISKED